MRNLKHRREQLGPHTLPTVHSRHAGVNRPTSTTLKSATHSDQPGRNGDAPHVSFADGYTQPSINPFHKCLTNASSHRIDWRRVRRIVCGRRIVGAVNLTVVLLLLWQFVSIIRWHGDGDMPRKLLEYQDASGLPYPLNLARLSTNGQHLPAIIGNPRIVTAIAHDADTVDGATATGHVHRLHHYRQHPWPGYASVRVATFRNKYPSTNVRGTGTFDNVFVVTNPRCERQWEKFEALAAQHGLACTKWEHADVREVSLMKPPLAILRTAATEEALGLTGGRGNRAIVAIVKRQIAYLDAHRRIWQHVVQTGRQRVLILDDTVFPTARMLASLPGALSNADEESVARAKPWHFMFLRRVVLSGNGEHPEAMWAMNEGYHHAAVRANISHGVGAYVLTLEGARFLLRHVTRFRVPLDVEVGLVMKEQGDKFVALSGCNNDAVEAMCPEMVHDISTPEWSRTFDCVWRRTQEVQTAGSFAEMAGGGWRSVGTRRRR